ncbi:MAG TPA: DUF1629 domain-containing protein [Longimicrobium sp.]|nr:DUF1629 domain-containing protein [Longimicrobium sp.]
MRIFELRPDVEGYRWLTLVRESDFNVLSDLDGSPVSTDWVALTAEWIDDDLNAGKPKSDFPTLGATPVFSQRAVDELFDVLVENGELLPLSVDDGTYYVYNTTRIIDALDEERSSVVRFSTGEVMRIAKYVFRDDAAFLPIFRLPQSRVKVFVTGPFVDRVKASALTGFDFRLVWDGPNGAR